MTLQCHIWTPGGTGPVNEFFEELDRRDPAVAAKLLRMMDLLQEKGLYFMMRGRYMDKFKYKNEDIYEIRASRNKVEYRLLGVLRGSIFWIVHGFIKKGQKTETRHLITAQERAKRI